MKIEVLKLIDREIDFVHGDTHKCKIIATGKIEYFDFYTDDSFPNEISPEELVGKTVEIEEMFPYSPFQFGRGVSVLQEQGND